MKLFIAVIYSTIAFLALATVATAAPPEQAKNEAQAKLSITPKRVDAGERFTLNARGFTPNATTVVYFAITGQEPYGSYVPFYPTNADGTFSIPFVFEACRQGPGGDESVNLTITLVDSSGVQDSARLTLC